MNPLRILRSGERFVAVMRGRLSELAALEIISPTSATFKIPFHWPCALALRILAPSTRSVRESNDVRAAPVFHHRISASCNAMRCA